MLGAITTGAASNYAGQNGDAATAASLLETQQQILNEQANTAAYNAQLTPTASVSVSTNIASGGIVGNWSNEKMTWSFSSDGNAVLTVPTENNAGVSNTYMTYTTQAGRLSYNISHSTFTGGISDIDQTVNKSYTENYTLNGNTLAIGTEVMQRN